MSHTFFAVLVVATTSLSLAALGCDRGESVSTRPAVEGPLAASAPVDPAFAGCAHSCGSRSAKDRAAARAQPGVEPGDIAFCPVSGAVFMVKQDSPHRDVPVRVAAADGGSATETRRLYFCCESCATWFTAHQADVLSRRGLTPEGA